MATYQQRGNSIRAIIRRSGVPAISRSFESMDAATAWADSMERDIKARRVVRGPKNLEAFLEKLREIREYPIVETDTESRDELWAKVKETVLEIRRDAYRSAIQAVMAGEPSKLRVSVGCAGEPADIEDILAAAKPLEMLCGVYFLVKENQVVYVGKSSTLYTRLSTHQRDKDFDRVAYMPCHESQLDATEQYFIAKLKPPLNKRHC